VVVVGGTGLYLRVLLRGVLPGPSADPALRARLEGEAAERGRPALHARLAEIDPASAAVIQPTDLVRIIRALELHALTGKPASVLRAEHAFAEARYRHRLVVLDPPREALYPAIDRRARGMFENGLVGEVRELVGRGYRAAAPMRSVGYVQALAVLDGLLPEEEAIEDTARETRRYAKRQQTWFKKEPGAERLAPPYRLG
jgi:tRNA dimethylallyltransferase